MKTEEQPVENEVRFFTPAYPEEEIFKSGIKFRQTLRDYIYFKLLSHFRDQEINVNGQTSVKALFPKKGRGKSWRSFRYSFPLKVPQLMPHPVSSTIAFLFLVMFPLFLFVLSFRFPEIYLVFSEVNSSQVLLPVSMVPVVILFAIFGYHHIPWKTIEDLAEAIVAHNWKDFLVNKESLKDLLKEERERGNT
ncbi:MAG: hypothetical protein AAFX87_24040 [Bacteroidota bacterium]